MAKKQSKMKADGEAAEAATATFEEALADLEAIVSKLEEGALGLEESLRAYERGIRRLRQCHEQLESVEKRIELLTGFDEEGNPILRPFDDEAGETLEAKQAARSRRRGSGGQSSMDDPSALF